MHHLLIYFLFRKHQTELDGEVFEMLYTLTDFVLFKEMMVDYKKAKTGDTVNLELTNSYFSCPATRADPMLLLNHNSGDKEIFCSGKTLNDTAMHTENANLGSSAVARLISLNSDDNENPALSDAHGSADKAHNSGI
ncbi:hypothetical protein FGIG_08463 [Fasciola gigantica]|uniref:ADP-ribosylation factor-like protein 2-binding protein n=1 Tax=Fasciola gigantica TaxID=46835 RepID=A0A504YU14_FASGI|nr:hypothetical protein FGIG_08463 [Fasciola gigantica]